MVCISEKERGDSLRDGTEYYLRNATSRNAGLIATWLEDPRDCRMAIGHAPLTDCDFQGWLEAEDQRCWILDGPDGPLGYGEIWVDETARDLELAHLMVSPKHRNQGLGRLLTALLFERGRQYGFPSVFMRIYPENAPALNCYASAGFTRVSDRTSDMGPQWVWLAKFYDGAHCV